MKRAGALLAVAAMVASVAAIILLPWPAAALLLAAAILAAPAVLPATLLAAAITVPLDVLLFALVLPTGSVFHLGPLAFGSDGALLGAQAALRLVALTAVALAWLRRLPAPRLVAALRLPPRLAGTVGALLLAAHDARSDWAALVLARRSEGTWPTGLRRIAAAASLVPALLAASLRRAATRRDALHLAGHDTGPTFVPLVAFAALAIAGRLLFLALPNIALTYLVVFLAGVLAGPRVGFLVGAVAMLASDLLLTGLLPMPLVNVPAMALLGLLGGLLRHMDWGAAGPIGRVVNVWTAALVGAAATLLFSLATDLATWLVLPEFRAAPETLMPLLAAGLAFNAVPAAVNALLFATAVPATVRSWRRWAPALLDASKAP